MNGATDSRIEESRCEGGRAGHDRAGDVPLVEQVPAFEVSGPAWAYAAIADSEVAIQNL